MPKSDRSTEFLFTGAIYLMFFFSGAAALVYEVVWVRALTLIFGGSHLSVTTVLSVFMGGLALGSYVIGRYGDRIKNPLRLYGILELGIALSAVICAILVKFYPTFYIAIVQSRDLSPPYLSFIRVAFSVVALILPTTLMGGTLPVLSRLVAGQAGSLGRHLSFLYGINTLGAVVGTIGAGFVLLRFYSASTALTVAILTNTAVGIVSFSLSGRFSRFKRPESSGLMTHPSLPQSGFAGTAASPFSYRLVLMGIGISGFCALGYEVLWTRMLTIVIGASVYGFTIMLAAFLTGIALGSKAYGITEKLFQNSKTTVPRLIAGFGAVQAFIGITALAVTFSMRDLPSVSIELKSYFAGIFEEAFAARQWSNLALAFLYMVIPAFFMGIAFPLAGRINGEFRKRAASAVGEVLAFNTVGAIPGAALSGYVMAYLLTIEQSLQIFVAVNIGLGALIITSTAKYRIMSWGAGAATIVALIAIAVYPGTFSLWNRDYFAIFRVNQPEVFRSRDLVQEALENTEVLYYAEGVEAIVSSIKIKGGVQSFITNGRVEASSNFGDQQVQYTLGHLPMLLSRDPKKVLVVGLGSGMTISAASVHPEAEKITLVELEPRMLGVAQTFKEYNHDVLINPKLKIIFNDGRNFLLTTKEKFDVITADPIHPWFRGAGYLYTDEYFQIASQHLNEGGVMCQWLPIYELTEKDLRSVVRTFTMNFPYAMLWLTYWDSVIVGSNTPFRIDEPELQRKIDKPAVAVDLERVNMGNARDLLSYFLMGTRGMQAFGEGGLLNTDDNLYLEFSAPLSIGKGYLMAQNASRIVQYRESILPYLAPAEGEKSRREQAERWKEIDHATRFYDQLHILFLDGASGNPGFVRMLNEFDTRYPWYGPGRFLMKSYTMEISREPQLVKQSQLFIFTDEMDQTSKVKISAVLSRVSESMAIVDFVDNDARVRFGHLNVPGKGTDKFIDSFVNSLLNDIGDLYEQETGVSSGRGMKHPPREQTLSKIRELISQRIRDHSG
ncbi:MAG: spermidine synthase [Nitrospiraceae bacterium]|nr:MAG: spermidine synthase [Nitrospiraceae bacterium]